MSIIDSSYAAKETSGIYQLECSMSGKAYIGRSEEIGIRVMAHIYILRARTHYNKKLQADFSKYGEESFSFSVLEECAVGALLEREDFHIMGRDRSSLYNKHLSYATGARGGEISEETRVKQSERQLGDKNHFYGKKHSDETRKHMSESASLRRAKRK